MMGYLLKRLAFMGVTVLAVCALTFFLMNIIPGGTAELILKHTVLEAGGDPHRRANSGDIQPV